MGLRMRKSFKLGPFRINLSKSGVGYSYGVKGYRVTHKAGGGVRTTASIPGTGISYVTETSAKKSQVNPSSPFSASSSSYASQPKPEGRYAQVTGKDGVTRYVGYMRCPYCGTEILETAVQCYKCKKNLKKGSSGGKAPKIAAAVLAGAVAIGGVGSMLGGEDEPAPIPDPAPVVEQIDPAPVPEPEPVVDEPPVSAEPEPAPAPDPTPAPAPVTPEPAPEPEVLAPVEPEPEQPAVTEVQYIGNANPDRMKFHKLSCHAIDDIKESNKVELYSHDEAISRGYTPCGICKP